MIMYSMIAIVNNTVLYKAQSLTPTEIIPATEAD